MTEQPRSYFNSLFVPELNVVLKCKELEHRVDDGDDESKCEQVDISLQESFLDTVLILVLLLLSHQVTENVEPEEGQNQTNPLPE